jgi:hypothetical protein
VPHVTDDVELVERELDRLDAAGEQAGAASIGVNDETERWVSLGATPERGDFYWYGRADELLERLRALPDGAGPEAVRREFRSDYREQSEAT